MFDKAEYWKRRKNLELVSLKDAKKKFGSVFCYKLVNEKNQTKVRTENFETIKEAEKAKKKGWMVMAWVHKPLPGVKSQIVVKRYAGKSGQHMTQTKKGVTFLNRIQFRRKFVDRTTTRKGYVYGVKIGSGLHEKLERAKRSFAKLHKGERIPTEEQRIHRENFPLRIDPAKSNHQRMLERKEARDASRSTTPAAV